MCKLRRLRQCLPLGINIGRRTVYLRWEFQKIIRKKGKAFPLPFFYHYLVFAILFFLFAAGPLSGDSPFPVISRLDARDNAFRQYISDVETARRIVFSSRQNRPEDLASYLTIYAYIPGEGEDLMSVAARCNIPYATLASLNRLSNMGDMTGGKYLLLPSVPGLFIPEEPITELERLLISSREDTGITLSIQREDSTERYRFIPGDDFTPNERVFFLNRDFRFPLRQIQVSSPYGPRINPVTGRPGVHRGLDLAAPEGTEVYAAKSGTVIDVGEDQILGKYVMISHDSNWVSLYGHLSAITTSLHAVVQSGSLIARVGSTGQSTGPHLHFELRQNGQTRDPAALLGIFRRSTGQ
jgi:hypothetical protein